jgi:ABC-type transport system involved in cytochrome bd biosynthesis fused ATPase/permease subunit
LNATLRDNILLGDPGKDKAFFQTVLEACALAGKDSLPAGENTEIGERGKKI